MGGGEVFEIHQQQATPTCPSEIISSSFIPIHQDASAAAHSPSSSSSLLLPNNIMSSKLMMMYTTTTSSESYPQQDIYSSTPPSNGIFPPPPPPSSIYSPSSNINPVQQQQQDEERNSPLSSTTQVNEFSLSDSVYPSNGLILSSSTTSLSAEVWMSSSNITTTTPSNASSSPMIHSSITNGILSSPQKKKPLPTTIGMIKKPLPPRPTQTTTEVGIVFSHPSTLNNSSDDSNGLVYVNSPPKVSYLDYSDTNSVYSQNSTTISSAASYNYELANINPEPISHIFTAVDGSMHRSTSLSGILTNRKQNNQNLLTTTQEDISRSHSHDKLKSDDSAKKQQINGNNNNNRKNKKIFYNTEFLERCGFSNNSIEQQQLKQLKQDEIQEEQIRQMHNEQERKLKQTEMEELALVNRTLQQEFSFSEYITSQPKYSWSDFFAHNKNAFSLIRAMASQWSWGEMTLGLEYFARSRAKMKRDFSSFILEAQLEKIPASEIEIWRHYARLTYQVFRDSIEDIPRNTKLELHKIIAYDRTQQAMRPGYFLCVDDFTKSILVIFRGTKSFSDILTDLHCSSIKYKYGYCHKGILTAAKYFDSNKFIKEVVRRTLDHHPGYKLRLLGHSLGGGTAAILATMWKKEFPDIHCYAFACPPVLSQILSDECAEYVTSFINGDDFVTRLSMTAVHELRKEVQNYPWKEEMMRDIQNSMIGKFAAGVKNYASGLFSGLFGSRKQEQEQIEQAILESKKEAQEEKYLNEKESQDMKKALEESKRIYLLQSRDELSTSSSSQEMDSNIGTTNEDTQSSTSEEPLSAVSSQSSLTDESFTKKRAPKKKKKIQTPDSPLIINDYENLVVTLFPAGKVYQIRNINGKVYIKRAKQEEISTIILSDSYKEDHRMINYLINLDALEI
ncbi:hypothetical protein FDP41_012361 [Naegleria fowleri]|uniref:Fungal lipase-type domain-containing protein n=1 Tax=Naegleria fowleri TaxID=5763 RepID=A0A6A5C5G1_NAEFO|nr:uncharacterized protein FDP41_012361 [Naegleria fowleri]KAF0981704.1 hypothetical protein FDP41_012361 [Naegleria fowleri]CAG4712075.1 unnamed protein product [Naegleria fowleri]